MRTARASVLLLLAGLPAQIAPGSAVVAVRLAGTPATALLAVDLQSGIALPLPRFPSDALPPLALAIDPVDRQLLLCVDAGANGSRVLRLADPSGAPGREWTVATVPGPVHQLHVTHDAILLVVAGPRGGLWSLPRTGGTPAPLLSRPHLGAVHVLGQGFGIVAWSGDPSTPAVPAGIGGVDFASGQFTLGPETFPGFLHPGITGVLDLATGVPRQLLSHADGAVSLHTMMQSSNPVPLPVQPPVPAGGAVAMKPMQEFSVVPLVLGGAAFPYLWTFDPWAAAPVRTVLAGPMPGDPVDFAIAPDTTRADLMQFGAPCGSPSMSVQVFSLPTLGNANFAVQLGSAAPGADTLFVLGLSDTLGGALPVPLPGGCLLRTSADSVWFHVTNPMGQALQRMPVPNQPGLVGLILFAQWLQAPAGGFTASAVQVIQVGR